MLWQYRLKSYVSKDGIFIPQDQFLLDYDYVQFQAQGGTLSKKEFYDYNGERIHISDDGQNIIFIFRDYFFCTLEGTKLVKDKNEQAKDYKNMYYCHEVECHLISRNVTDRVTNEGHEVCIKWSGKNADLDDNIQSFRFTLFDDNRNATFLSANGIHEYKKKDWLKAIALTGMDLVGIALDGAGLFLELSPGGSIIYIGVSTGWDFVDYKMRKGLTGLSKEDAAAALEECLAKEGISCSIDLLDVLDNLENRYYGGSLGWKFVGNVISVGDIIESFFDINEVWHDFSELDSTAFTKDVKKEYQPEFYDNNHEVSIPITTLCDFKSDSLTFCVTYRSSEPPIWHEIYIVHVFGCKYMIECVNGKIVSIKETLL